MPGMFWLVMVTRNSGRAMATTVDQLERRSDSQTSTGASRAPDVAERAGRPRSPRRRRRRRRAPPIAGRPGRAGATPARTGATAAGESPSARNGSTHSATAHRPASRSPAGSGWRATGSPRGRTRPLTPTGPRRPTNAPTRRLAAVGDRGAGEQRGARAWTTPWSSAPTRHEKSSDQDPSSGRRTSRPDAASSAVAPTRLSPVRTTANEREADDGGHHSGQDGRRDAAAAPRSPSASGTGQCSQQVVVERAVAGRGPGLGVGLVVGHLLAAPALDGRARRALRRWSRPRGTPRSRARRLRCGGRASVPGRRARAAG